MIDCNYQDRVIWHLYYQIRMNILFVNILFLLFTKSFSHGFVDDDLHFHKMSSHLRQHHHDDSHSHKHSHSHSHKHPHSHSHKPHSHSHKHSHQQHAHTNQEQNALPFEYSPQQKQLNQKQFEKLIADMDQKFNAQTNQERVTHFMQSCQRQVGEWISMPKEQLNFIIEECSALQNADILIQFYQTLSKFGADFSKDHIDLIIAEFKKSKSVPQILKCIVSKRQIENKYLQQPKKYKYLAQFIRKYPSQGKDAFPSHKNYSLIGQKACHFLKALFQFYYLDVLSPSQTLSTQFLRALTVRSQIFQHEDIAYCISLDSVGKLTEDLQDLDINNIYIRIPDIYHSLRYLKLKEKCKDEHNLELIRNLHKALEGLDMFQIMYHQYEPFVEIAAEKFVQTQIRLLARKFAQIILNKEKYMRLSKTEEL